MKDYSQHGEQQVILDYFKGFTGNLLDIGANDGETFSNSRALIEEGWKANLIEPSKRGFERLSNLYRGKPGINLFNAAVGNKNEGADLYESGSLLNGHDTALVSTLIFEETFRWKSKQKPEHKIARFTITPVQVYRWKSFLNSFENRTFDFITIDIEGMELEVLRQMDIKELGCKLICVEYNGKNQEEFDRLIPMPVIYKNRTNIIYGI